MLECYKDVTTLTLPLIFDVISTSSNKAGVISLKFWVTYTYNNGSMFFFVFYSSRGKRLFKIKYSSNIPYFDIPHQCY